MTELLSCPFCGGRANLKAWSNPAGEFGPGCTECGVTADAGVWNRRATHPAPAEQVEVVAYAVEHPEVGYKVYKQFSPWMTGGEWECSPLMTVAQHNRIMAATVPAGCKVVPVEPTEAMRRAAQDKLADEGFIVTDWLVHAIYTAMLASAEGVKYERG